ncbi:MAG: HIT family protein [bacterium]|nr:HIT family protein [bacterium]
MINVDELKEKGICPTCYNKEHGGVYTDLGNRLLYEDDIIECFFEERPRSIGHTIILVKSHYNDMSFLPDDVCEYVYKVAKKMMNILKEVLKVERVYLCTMCDGKINHFHLQLIPRYPNETIGSKNFVKERKKYIEDINTIEKIKVLLND